MFRCLVSYLPGGRTRHESWSWGVHLGSPFGGRGVSNGTIGKSDGGFLQAVHCDHCAISNRSHAICRRMSATLKSTGGGSLWGKMWEGTQILTRYAWDMGLSYANMQEKLCSYLLLFEHNAWTWQTDTPRNDSSDHNRWKRLSIQYNKEFNDKNWHNAVLQNDVVNVKSIRKLQFVVRWCTN